jgi:predicted metal-dependent hydrolase
MRNTRPRDIYGRPLPYGAEGEPTIPDDLDLSPVDALAEAQRLLDADRPFHAHEVLESVWKAAPEGERELWRGLAQVAVGLTHVRRGNARGAQALLTRAADRLEPFRGDPAGPYGLDLPTLVRDVRALAGRLETETPGALTDLGVGLLRRP